MKIKCDTPCSGHSHGGCFWPFLGLSAMPQRQEPGGQPGGLSGVWHRGTRQTPATRALNELLNRKGNGPCFLGCTKVCLH